MGILLLWLMPVPYVDASAASAMPEKRRRMLIGAAGILIELFVAAAGFLAWLHFDPGLARDAAFNLALIGGVSALLFNGNPLMRFDGYFVLADAIEIPNLAHRSTLYLGYLARRYLFGLRAAPSPVTAPGERGWLLGYGIAAFIYRIVIIAVLALFVAGHYPVLGIVLATWAVAVQLVLPLGKGVLYLLRAGELDGRRTRAIGAVALIAAAVGVPTFAVPVPLWTRAEGVVLLPEHTQVRAGVAGFVERVLARDGQTVHAGEVLFELADVELSARLAQHALRIRELEARIDAVRFRDRAEAEILAAELQVERDGFADAERQAARLSVRSPVDGVLVAPRAIDLPGRHLAQGELLGYVDDGGRVVARIVVPQAAAARVRERHATVEARLPARPGTTLRGELLREVPAATATLPSAVLGTLGGGGIAVDARDEQGVRTIDRVFLFDVVLPRQAWNGHVGSRARVRIGHGAEPLAHRWGRWLGDLVVTRLQI